MVFRAAIVVLFCFATVAWANDRQVNLYVPTPLIESGLLKHILPRFTLKTQVRVTVVPDSGEANLRIGESGQPLFQGLDQVWRLEVASADHPGTQRFAEWLKSDVGQRTITSFAPDGTALFGPPAAEARQVVELSVDGDAKLGHEVSRAKCTRCHAVDEATRGWGIGSTPSFSVLRALPDWEDRFSAFFALNPHPAFTQIEDVTEPFPIDRPSPIEPVELSLDELEALLAYVTALQAADLGKPLDHQ